MMEHKHKHLIVGGTGAVGQVYADALLQGGASVGLYVRQKYADELKSNKKKKLQIFDINSSGRMRWSMNLFCALIAWGVLYYWSRLTKFNAAMLGFFPFLMLSDWYMPRMPGIKRVLKGFKVYTKPEQVAGFEYVWLCVSSVHIRQGRWLKEMLEQFDPKTYLVLTTPGWTDKDYVLSLWDHPDRIILGTIGFISWQAPLSGELYSVTPPKSKGIALFCPIGQQSMFAGPKTPTIHLINSLRRGRLPAGYTEENPLHLLATSNVGLTTFLLGLEMEDWLFRKMKTSKWLGLVSEGGREAMSIVNRNIGREESAVKWAKYFFSPLLIKLILIFAPIVMPFDIETYLDYHFSKVNDQSVWLMQSFIKHGTDLKMPTDNLRTLLKYHAAFQEKEFRREREAVESKLGWNRATDKSQNATNDKIDQKMADQAVEGANVFVSKTASSQRRTKAK